ncbi:MAG TPA: hypothetical protein VK307_05010 [Thermoleophilaceae bacterium]|nr:hypothetical protein [Thermoleophilaceae bacterium]
MPAKIDLTGGASLLVQEEPEAVAAAFAAAEGLVQLTRKEGYSDPGGIEGQPVYVNPAQVAAVTPA